MTSAAELRDQMLNRRTSSATEAQAMRERNVDADMLNRQEMRERNVDAPRGQKVYWEPGPPSSHSPSPARIQRDGSVSPQVLSHVGSAVCAQICAQEARSRARERVFIAVGGGAGLA